MVLILPPPPQRNPDPHFYTLSAGTSLRRIFDPTSHNTQALTFRHFGPINRFDHQRSFSGSPSHDSDRGIYYAGFTLSCCLVEIFGDQGVIEIKDQQVCLVHIKQDLTLLDLRGSGAMKAGSVSALAKIADRKLSQSWSRYFYEETSTYGFLDGILYFNAHNDEEAIALYERSQSSLTCPNNQIMRLDHPSLRASLQHIALSNNLDFPP